MDGDDRRACAQCGREVLTSALVYDGQARLICTSCETDAEIARTSSKNIIQAGIAPPVLALLGTMMFCVPMLNLIAPFACGVAAIVTAIHAIRLGADRTNPGVTSNSQPLLLISGILAGLWALLIVAVQVMAWVGMSCMSMRGY